MTVYFAVVAGGAFAVQVVRTWIAWKEWTLRKRTLVRKYVKEVERGERPKRAEPDGLGDGRAREMLPGERTWRSE